jgi:transcriptional repressor NrdR
MKCPFCGKADSKVIDSRTGAAQEVIRRRRECETCARRFTTYERVEEIVPLVVKKDGRREPYDRAKLVAGVLRASEKRAIAANDIERLVDEVEQELVDLAEKEAPSHVLGEAVMRRLRKLDEIAYVRFASVYRSFRDLAELQEELNRMLSQRGQP